MKHYFHQVSEHWNGRLAGMEGTTENVTLTWLMKTLRPREVRVPELAVQPVWTAPPRVVQSQPSPVQPHGPHVLLGTVME